MDEALIALSAMDLSRQWSWHPFYSLGQIPPLMNWLEGLLFKFSDSVYWNLWLPPFLFSFIAALFFYLACRSFFPKRTSLYFLALLVLGFWPAFSGNFCIQATLVPFWEGVAMLLMGFYFRSSIDRVWLAAALGLWVALGFWTYSSWPVVAVFFFLVMLLYPAPDRGKGRTWFTLTFLAGALPYLFLALTEGMESHLFYFSILSHWSDLVKQLGVSTDYLNGLFWGFRSQPSLYVPPSGGLLNPIGSVLVGWGLWTTPLWLPEKKHRLILASGLVLFLLPGLLSQNLQFFRVVQFYPLLFLLAAQGLDSLSLALGGSKGFRGIAWTLILLSAVWDSGRLIQDFKGREAKGNQVQIAFEDWRKVEKDLGPGLIFADFGLGQDGLALATVCHPFNILCKGPERWRQAPWAGWLINIHFLPFVSSVFPTAQWFRLPLPEGDEPRDNLVMGMVSLSTAQPKELRTLGAWVQADAWFQKVQLETNDIYGKATYEKALRDMLKPDPVILQDRFLASCYWTGLDYFYYSTGYKEHYYQQVLTLKNAVQMGYPAANIYYNLGSLLMRGHHYQEAREAFLNAEKCPINLNPTKQALAILDRLESAQRTTP